MRRRTFLAGAATAMAAGPAVLATAGPAHAAAPASPAVTFTNPIAQQRADPHIFKHTDGYYYFTATVPAYDRIVMRRATTLQGLSTAAETTIWTKHASGEMGAHIWAPEIHFIDGKWYIYFAAGDADDIWKIRPYVLESARRQPADRDLDREGPYRPAAGHLLARRDDLRRRRQPLSELGAERSGRRQRHQPLPREDVQPVDHHRHSGADLHADARLGDRRATASTRARPSSSATARSS